MPRPIWLSCRLTRCLDYRFPLLTLEALARSTYEDTAAEQRYLAAKRAMAQQWEEAGPLETRHRAG